MSPGWGSALSDAAEAPEPTADPMLLERVRGRLARELQRGDSLAPERVAWALRQEGAPVGDATARAVLDSLHLDVVGAGPLQELLDLDGVTDVLVNGPGAVYVERGSGLELTGVRFADDDAVRRLAQRLASRAGRRLDDAAPYADLRLADGTRFHAVLAPLSRPGTLVSLRVPRRRAMSLGELVEAGSVPGSGADLLVEMVERRLAFLVSGGTGSGKTTLLDALLSRCPESERLVIVEDTSELRPAHPHTVALEARPANIEGAGAIDLRTLVRQALRMRPDRLVVGEVRGEEVVDLLAALNTGHRGGCATVHANSAVDVVSRIEGLALAAGLPSDAAHAQLAAGVQAVVHCRRDHTGRRRVQEIALLERQERCCVAVPAVVYGPDGVEEGPAAERLARLLQESDR